MSSSRQSQNKSVQSFRLSTGGAASSDPFKKSFSGEGINDNYSDTEASVRHKKNNLYLGGDAVEMRSSRATNRGEDEQDGLLDNGSSTPDEFGSNQNLANKVMKTGRQRKKQAARSKGGEFQTKRKKRRIYFCCVSSEIDIQKLHDYLVGSGGLFAGWKFLLHNDVLHMYHASEEKYNYTDVDKSNDFRRGDSIARTESVEYGNDIEAGGMKLPTGGISSISPHTDDMESGLRLTSKAQEVFVFEFGAAVFWGFSRGEETNLLKIVRGFVTRGYVGVHEFGSGEDDIAFVTHNDPEVENVSIENDVITFPENTPPKQRLSVSFAIAQSSVLTIFESRIQQKIEEYKYIPEALAVAGKLQLRERQLGIMIGEVFVIRHDVNLHSEILDVPDFFWKQEKFEQDYKLVYKYLEMAERTEVLNKRLDMLRDLLDVLQQQLENAHAVKLEWIVIWLIVIEVLVQALAVGGESMGWYRSKR